MQYGEDFIINTLMEKRVFWAYSLDSIVGVTFEFGLEVYVVFWVVE